MAKKSDLLAYAEQNGWKYPRLYVIVKFGGIGGFIGGLIFACGMGFDILFIHPQHLIFSLETIGMMILALGSFGLLGVLMGLIPATVTGLYVAMQKMILMSWWDYLHLYIFGTIVSAISFIFWGNFRDDTPLEIARTLWLFGSVGGISAMICGKLFLPKAKL